jgi:hypothetical protein
MTRRVRSRLFPAGCTALLLLAACRAQECRGSSPSPNPSPSPSATSTPVATPRVRWAIVAVFKDPKGGECNRVAGPPRVGARVGDTVIWRVYNLCRKQQTVRIGDFVFQEKDPGVPSPAEDIAHQIGARAAAKKAAGYDPDDPFEPGDRKVTINAGEGVDLKMTVKAGVKYGVYSYFTFLSDKPDADQQIEIWP